MLVTLLLAVAQTAAPPPAATPRRHEISPSPAAPAAPQAVRCDARTPVQSLGGAPDASYVIDQPGSYYLTDNITGEAGKMGIKITASHVSVDLNGFALLGKPAAREGIQAAFPVSNVLVRNGNVNDWGDQPGEHGIDLESAANTHVLDVNASGNGGAGIAIGFSGVLANCSASANGSAGFSLSSDSTAAHCSAQGNQGGGFSIGRACVIEACTAYQNGGSGFFAGGGRCTIRGSTAHENVADGFSIGGQSHIDACTATDNGGSGILALEGSAVISCSASGNRLGGLNAFDGGCEMAHCEVFANRGFGIAVGVASRVTHCSLKANEGPSIHATAECTISDNDCSTSGIGSIGILVEGARNRLEANSVAGGATGVKITAAGNLVVRNSVAGAVLPYDVIAGNTVGPIVDSSSIATSSNPHANYRF